ncbi:MAG: hypothetical protein A2V98_04170 [Planctomycetes bacterium RBG_16_64_12]|nr:MAG: hypothetical protein A2V98_04170 [Planctomycetes bacterium RBG_16_64_12]
MIIGYHIIFGAYGFWLPNDPRGSWSEQIWARHLRPFGKATKVTTRRSLAHDTHDHARRIRAKQHLKYPAVRFSGLQARAVGRGFSQVVQDLELRVYACAIMPDHVHLVTGRHRRNAEDIAGFLKRAGTRRLNAEGLHPVRGHRQTNGRIPSPWAEQGWCVYLDTLEEMHQRIRYVEENPVEAGLARQRWPFVVVFER